MEQSPHAKASFADKLCVVMRFAGVNPDEIESIEAFQKNLAPRVITNCFKVLYPERNAPKTKLKRSSKKKKKSEKLKDVNDVETVLSEMIDVCSNSGKGIAFEPILMGETAFKLAASLSKSNELELLQSISATEICDGNPQAIGTIIGILYHSIIRNKRSKERVQPTFASTVPASRSRSASPATFEQFDNRTTDLPTNPYVQHLTTDPPPVDRTLLSNINRLKLRDEVKSELARTLPSSANITLEKMAENDGAVCFDPGLDTNDLTLDDLEFEKKRRGFGVFLLNKLVRKAKGAKSEVNEIDDDTSSNQDNPKKKKGKKKKIKKIDDQNKIANKSPIKIDQDYLDLSWSVDVLGGEIGDIIEKHKPEKKKKRPASAPNFVHLPLRKSKSTLQASEDFAPEADVFRRLYAGASTMPKDADYLNSEYLQSLGLSEQECFSLLRSDSFENNLQNNVTRPISSRAVPNFVNGKKVYIAYNHQTGHRLSMTPSEFYEQEKQWKLKNGEPSDEEMQGLLLEQRAFTISKPSSSSSHFQEDSVELDTNKRNNNIKAQWPGYNTGQRTDAWIHRARKEVLIEKFSKVKGKQVSHSYNHALSELVSRDTFNFRLSSEFEILSSYAKPLDLIIAVEHCHDCENHQTGLRHNPHQYVEFANSFMKVLTEIAHNSRLCCRVGVCRFDATLMNGTNSSIDKERNGGTSLSRIGAFEIHVLYQPQSGPGNDTITETLHSKLSSQRWPSKSVLRKRFQSFLSKVNVPTFDMSVLDMEPDFESQKGTEGLHPYPIGPIIPFSNCPLSSDSWEFPVPALKSNQTCESKKEKEVLSKVKKESVVSIQWAYDCKVAANMHFFQLNKNVFVTSVDHPRGGKERNHLIGRITKSQSRDNANGLISIRLNYHESDVMVEPKNCITFGSLTAPPIKSYPQDVFPKELGLVFYYALNPDTINIKCEDKEQVERERWRLIDSNDAKNVKTGEIHLTRSSFFHQIRNVVWDLEKKVTISGEGLASHPFTSEKIDLQYAYNEGVLDWVFGHYGNLVNMSDLESLARIQLKRFQVEAQLKEKSETLRSIEVSTLALNAQHLSAKTEDGQGLMLMAEKSSKIGIVSPRPGGSPRPSPNNHTNEEKIAKSLVESILGTTINKEDTEHEPEHDSDESADADYGEDFDPLSPVKKLPIEPTEIFEGKKELFPPVKALPLASPLASEEQKATAEEQKQAQLETKDDDIVRKNAELDEEKATTTEVEKEKAAATEEKVAPLTPKEQEQAQPELKTKDDDIVNKGSDLEVSIAASDNLELFEQSQTRAPLTTQPSISLSQYLADSDNNSSDGDDMSAAAMHQLMGASLPTKEETSEDVVQGYMIVREHTGTAASESPESSEDEQEKEEKIGTHAKDIKDALFDDLDGYSDDEDFDFE